MSIEDKLDQIIKELRQNREILEQILRAVQRDAPADLPLGRVESQIVKRPKSEIDELFDSLIAKGYIKQTSVYRISRVIELLQHPYGLDSFSDYRIRTLQRYGFDGAGLRTAEELVRAFHVGLLKSKPRSAPIFSVSGIGWKTCAELYAALQKEGLI